MNRRRLIVAGVAVAMTGRLAMGAVKRDVRVGYLELVKGSDGALLYREFVEEFEAAGYVTGRNLRLSRKSAEAKPERLRTLAADLAAAKVDLIVAASTEGARGAKLGAPKTPVVFVISGDPVLEGLVKSLAKPEGMLTGITTYSIDLTAKRVQILKEAFPKVRKIAVVGSSLSMSRVAFNDAARALQLEIEQYPIHALADYRDAAAAIARSTSDAVLVVEDVDVVNNVGAFVRLMMATRKPVMFNSDLFVDEFGLMSYGAACGSNTVVPRGLQRGSSRAPGQARPPSRSCQLRAGRQCPRGGGLLHRPAARVPGASRPGNPVSARRARA